MKNISITIKENKEVLLFIDDEISNWKQLNRRDQIKILSYLRKIYDKYDLMLNEK